VTKPGFLSSPDNYVSFFNDLKQRIRQAQVKAALAVNQELLLLYWQIGKEILERQQAEKWGSKIIDRLAKDLKYEFPDMNGFSRSNLKYMRLFAQSYAENQISQAPLGEIPWYHNIALLEKLKNAEERLWYAQKTIENGWSRNVLVMQIESDLYRRQGGAVTNFAYTLPQPQSDLAQNLIKDPYNFDFLTLKEGAQERELERALVDHIRDFLLELGVGFAFLGSQYPIQVDGKDYRLDLLFYHVQLRCYIVIDLKMTEFEPEFTGKMNFYVSAVDDLLRHPYDQPTIGLILCKSKSKTTAEYALRNLNTPIGVSTHRLPKQLKDSLPSIEQLEIELEAIISEIDRDKSPSVLEDSQLALDSSKQDENSPSGGDSESESKAGK
jgi:predicted nuclease of restriction endonuclease-like (RecB) superfamily